MIHKPLSMKRKLQQKYGRSPMLTEIGIEIQWGTSLAIIKISNGV